MTAIMPGLCQSALQRPAPGPSALGRVESHFLVEDRGALCDAHLAEDQAVLGRDDADVAVVTAADGADDVAVRLRVLDHRLAVAVSRSPRPRSLRPRADPGRRRGARPG